MPPETRHGRMRRFLVFAMLGPPLGLFAGLYVLLPVLNWGTGGESQAMDWHQIVLLPPAYALGLIPALVTAAVDAALARRRIRWRPLWTALFAGVASLLPLTTALLMGFLPGPLILLWGMVGLLPGFVCAMLAGEG